jgi:nitric oxide dioxygenase
MASEHVCILGEETLSVVRATAPAVIAKADDIVANFYPRMLGTHPELFQYFNKTNQRTGRQRNALVESILGYVTNIDRLEKLTPAVERIAHKHCALNIQPAQYQIVHDMLMASIAEVLGEAVTPAVGKAWSEAVMSLAGILIKREAELYEEAANAPGGWMGERDFVVRRREQEADGICSLWLASADGKPVSAPQPSQHVTVVVNPTSDPVLAPRHYTITGYGEDHYRITPKRLVSESGAADQQGVISNYLNELEVGASVRLFPPFGVPMCEKALKPKGVAVLVSSGIGITPIVSVLPSLLKAEQRVALFHADHNAASYAFREHLCEQVASQEGALIRDYYAHPAADDLKLPNAVAGRLTGEAVVAELAKGGVEDLSTVHLYICCNPTLLLEVASHLKSKGVAHVHDLNFGPHVAL